MAVCRVEAAGGAMGLYYFLLWEEDSKIRMPVSMAFSRSLASWRAYDKVKDDAALKKLAEEDLRDSHAVALASLISHSAPAAHGSAFVWDNSLFKFVALLYISRCRVRDKNCVRHLRDTFSSNRLRKISTLAFGLAAKLRKMPRGDRLIHSIDQISPEWQKDIDEIVHSDYVFFMPARHEGPARCGLLGGIRDRTLRDEVEAIYVDELEANKWNAWEHTKQAKYEFLFGWDIYATGPDDLETWSRYDALTVGQGLELLEAIEKNKLLEALVTQRPPNSHLISHFTAILDCTEHARLFLARSELAVYYNFPDLKYSNLAVSTDTDMVLHSPLGFGERLPSPFDKLLRRFALEVFASVYDQEDAEEAPRCFLTVPPGSGFGKLNSLPVCPNDDWDRTSWFPMFVRVLETISTCEPHGKLAYLLGQKAASAKHSMFVDEARDTKLINWPGLAYPDDEVLYRGDTVPPLYLSVLPLRPEQAAQFARS